MDIHDNNPERRNLILLSMSIVAFHIGKGGVSGDEGLTLPIAKLTFENPLGLAVLALVILSWFAFRYWIEHQNKIMNTVFWGVKARDYFIKPFLGYAERLRKEKLIGPGNSDPTWSTYHVEDDCINYPPFLSVDFGYTGNTPVVVQVKGYRLYILWLLFSVRTFFSNPSTSAFVAPLFLFLLALGFGIYDLAAAL